VILTRSGIKAAIEKNQIRIHPFNEEQLNPNSYDLRLGNTVVVYTDHILDAAVKPRTREFEIPAAGLLLTPGQLYLMATVEQTETSHFVPGIEGRSSVGRLGISVHATAGFGDVGFKGTWTLEVSAIRPVIIYAGMRICQIFFEACSEIMPGDLYVGQYLNQVSPKPSGIHREVDEWHRG
jgi:dCTP deaminase